MSGELYEDKYWQIVRNAVSLPNGKQKCVSRARRVDSAHIIAFITPEKILILREYRPYYGAWIWMIPSGRVDKETEHALAAQRELREETGYRANHIELFCKTNYSESVISTNYIFIAKELAKDPLPQDDDELIEVHEVTLEQAIKNVLESDVVHTASAYGLLRYARENR